MHLLPDRVLPEFRFFFVLSFSLSGLLGAWFTLGPGTGFGVCLCLGFAEGSGRCFGLGAWFDLCSCLGGNLRLCLGTGCLERVRLCLGSDTGCLGLWARRSTNI